MSVTSGQKVPPCSSNTSRRWQLCQPESPSKDKNDTEPGWHGSVIEHRPVNGSILSQGTFPGSGLDPSVGCARK